MQSSTLVQAPTPWDHDNYGDHNDDHVDDHDEDHSDHADDHDNGHHSIPLPGLWQVVTFVTMNIKIHRIHHLTSR